MPDNAPATIVFPVSDLEAAKPVFTALLGEPYADTPYYVGYRGGGPEIALDPNGAAKGMTGPVVYWPCDDIRARLDELVRRRRDPRPGCRRRRRRHADRLRQRRRRQPPRLLAGPELTLSCGACAGSPHLRR